MYVQTKELAPELQDALKSVRYGAADIKVIAAETVELATAGGDGQRGFATLVNLATGERKSMLGSWGGSNMFVKTAVDDSDGRAPLPPHGVLIKGTMGYPRTFATLYAHPAAIGRYLQSGDEETLTDAEQQAIYCFAAIKGGEYRRDEMRRRGVTSDVVDSLVSRGYLKRNKAGATQITTKGKNARTVRY